ncbi:MAG: tetratricopeptide repeat protein [Gammaproteobacteria bacterium]|nr:tetratricopeptide repeat protein [Gammaproteobacteria bacterium]
MGIGTGALSHGDTIGRAALMARRGAARNLKLLGGLSVLLVVAACAPMSSQPPAPVVVPAPPKTGPALPPPAKPAPVPEVRPSPRPAMPPPPRVIPPPVAPDAVSALLQQANSEARAGRHDAAIALGERAQRLDPRAPEVYLVLGRAHLARGQAVEARQLALKGVALSAAGTEVRQGLEALLRDTGS